MEIIKIVLVDDHSIFLKGLNLLLNEVADFKVVGESANGLEFIEKLPLLNPDVVLMDIKMPVMDGIQATRKALELRPGLKVIALTMFGEPNYCVSMADAGAVGFAQKNISGTELEKAIKTVVQGETYFSEYVRKDLTALQASDLNTVYDAGKLTKRESEILVYIVKGLTAQEIAGKMFLSSRTVEGHKANLLSKTGTRNVVELVIYAIRNHLVEL